MSQEIVKVTSVEMAAERTRPNLSGNEAVLAPAAAAALNLLAEAITRDGADYDAIVQSVKDSQVGSALARIFHAASERVMEEADDPYDFDVRLRTDNLSAAGSEALGLFDYL